MPETQIAKLSDRGVIRVGGRDAAAFLQGLITNDLERLVPETALFAGLLSPQGKILFDFLILEQDGAFLLDVAHDQIPGLIKRLTLYRLRADVTIDDLSTTLHVHAAWGDDLNNLSDIGVAARDPRHPNLGQRILVEKDASKIATASSASYHAHRISIGIPEGGKDYLFSDSYPHEALYDILHGVSFTKGCFIGQEVVSRMEHRGATKKRIIKVKGAATLPSAGTDISAGDITLGRLGTSDGLDGLALIRIDRLKDISQDNQPATADGVELRFSKPDWAPFEL